MKIRRRTFLKSMALFAAIQPHAIVGAVGDTHEPPYFLHWKATPQVQAQLKDFGLMAKCENGKAILRQMVLIAVDVRGEPSLLARQPEVDGVMAVQLCVGFSLGFISDQPDATRVFTTLDAPETYYDMKNGNIESADFWKQEVANVEFLTMSQNRNHPLLSEQLGMPATSSFTIQKAGAQWNVLCYTGVWFEIRTQDGQMAELKKVQFRGTLNSKFVDCSVVARGH